MSIVHENKLPGDNLYNFVRDVADACPAHYFFFMPRTLMFSHSKHYSWKFQTTE